ncbi:MAG: Gfo/Idh/MocA family oxidoreductase, partial [Fimbriimonadales bacterium]
MASMVADEKRTLSRREFLKGTVGLTATVALGALPIEAFAHAQGSDRIRIGLVGCGGRGTGAAMDCLRADPGVVVHALGDIFKDRLDACRTGLKEEFKERADVPEDRCFLGFDAYKAVIDSGIDMVLLCAPPAFRPIHFLYAVQAGKHVFMEKPVAVCPEGVRMVLRGGEIATQKRLGVMPGTQYRHHPGYIEVIQRIRDGQIGALRTMYAYYNAGSPGVKPRQPNWSEMEYQ